MLPALRSSRLTIDRKDGPRRDPADPLERCRAGDQRAWDEIIDRYGRLVYSVPRRYGLSEADAEDVHQAVFLALYRRLDSIRDPSRLSSWLITTAHRESWRVGRRGPRAADAADLEQRIADVGRPCREDLERWEQQHLVRVGLEQLGGRCQALLTALFTRTEPGYEQIAAELGMKIGSIGPTRARCFAKLEKILLELGVEAPPPAGSSPGAG